MSTSPWKLQEDPLDPLPPSFEPWVGRVQMVRSACAAVGLVVVALIAWTAGTSGEQSLMYGIMAGLTLYFLGWIGALLICGELYAHELSQARGLAEQRERERREKLEEMYRERMRRRGLIDEQGNPTPEAEQRGLAAFAPPPPAPAGAGGTVTPLRAGSGSTGAMAGRRAA